MIDLFDAVVPDFVSLYVARERSFDLKKIDFIFGGSTLGTLASRKIAKRRHFVVALLKTTRDTHAIQSVNRSMYEQNFADPGYQFERFVLGEDLGGKHHTGIQHIQLLSVGEYSVLFCCESDAIDEDNNMVEVKASNPRYWGTNTMFQMISNGSAVLYHGKRHGPDLQHVAEKSLEQVINETVQFREVPSLEESISSAMTIKKFVNEGNLADGRKFELVFNDGGIEFKEWNGSMVHNIPEDVQNDLLGI